MSTDHTGTGEYRMSTIKCIAAALAVAGFACGAAQAAGQAKT
ncbi:putative membrane protein [Burkholderia cepacia]|nr:putative membrane protein [Burkholderia cepacia]